MPASGHELDPHPAEKGVRGAERLIDDPSGLIHVLEDRRAAAIQFVGSSTEPSPGAELLASKPGSPASEEFTGMVHGREMARPQSGWDPYEVWRTRVKGSSTVIQEREREPLRERVRRALRARAGAIARAVQGRPKVAHLTDAQVAAGGDRFLS